MRRFIFSLVVACTPLLTLFAQQQPPPTFASRTDLVTVDVHAVDPAGSVTINVVARGLNRGGQGAAAAALTVRLLGDITGDGRGDLIVGAPESDDSQTTSRPGHVYYFSGLTGGFVRMIQSPGSIADANDAAQFAELETLGELTRIAWKHDVQVMIEGPGHVPMDKIKEQVDKEVEWCDGAPFYVLGPLVTDIGMGYDHITAAIGGAVAGAAGADFLCYVTPSEHIRLPTIEDVKEGVIVSKLAAHAADIAKGIKGALDADIRMARCRKALDWNGQIALSLNPDKVREWRAEVPPTESEVCSMCGEFCAIRTVERALKKKA